MYIYIGFDNWYKFVDIILYSQGESRLNCSTYSYIGSPTITNVIILKTN